MTWGQLAQPYTSIYQTVTAGVITARSLLVLMDTFTWKMMLFTPQQRILSHSGSSSVATPERSFTHQKGACWYIDMEDDDVDTTPEEA